MNAQKRGKKSNLSEDDFEWRVGDQWDTFDERPYQEDTGTNWHASPFDDSITNPTDWYDWMKDTPSFTQKRTMS